MKTTNSLLLPFVLATVSGLVVASNSWAGAIERLGMISGNLGEISGEWRLIARDERTNASHVGAALTMERDSHGSYATMHLNGLPARGGPSPAGTLRGNQFLRLEIFFDLPPDADFADIEGVTPSGASIAFVETWPSNVEVPALQFTNLYTPIDVELLSFSLSDDAGSVEGEAAGTVCLFAFHRDDRDGTTPSEARIMNTQPCEEFFLEFSTDVILIEG